MIKLETERIELNYNQLLLAHLSRISALSTFVPHQIIGNNYTSSTEGDKVRSFHFSVDILKALIPKEIRDKEFQNKLNEFTEKIKKEAEEIEKQGKNISVLDKFYFGKLALMVDLLARKGFLFEETSIMRLTNKNKQKKEPTEEWEK